MMLAPMSIPVPPEERQSIYGTNLPSVLSELEAILQRHDGRLGELPPDEETHLLQICYVLAMYDAFNRGSFASKRNSPLYTLKSGAKWRAHLNRVSERDIAVLQALVEPAAELFPLVSSPKVFIGPVFADSHLVDGADGDLIINGNLIEIKCEAPGFRAGAVRQAIAYSLLDTTNEYELKKCSIYLARFGGFASWDLNEIIREVSHGRCGYESLRQEFHAWLVSKEMERQAKLDVRAESQRRFATQWQAVSDATDEYVKSLSFGLDASLLALTKLGREQTELRRLESETGLDVYWS
jgi:hypothetical protein